MKWKGQKLPKRIRSLQPALFEKLEDGCRNKHFACGCGGELRIQRVGALVCKVGITRSV